MYSITIKDESGRILLMGGIKKLIAERLMTYLRAVIKNSHRKEEASDTM